MGDWKRRYITHYVCLFAIWPTHFWKISKSIEYFTRPFYTYFDLKYIREILLNLALNSSPRKDIKNPSLMNLTTSLGWHLGKDVSERSKYRLAEFDITCLNLYLNDANNWFYSVDLILMVVTCPETLIQRTLTVGGSITVELVSSFTSGASLNTKNYKFSSIAKSSLVKLETSCTVILPPTVSVLCSAASKKSSNVIKVAQKWFH